MYVLFLFPSRLFAQVIDPNFFQGQPPVKITMKNPSFPPKSVGQDSCSDSSDRSLDRRIQEEVMDELCWASVDEASDDRFGSAAKGLRDLEVLQVLQVMTSSGLCKVWKLPNKSVGKLLRSISGFFGVFWVH